MVDEQFIKDTEIGIYFELIIILFCAIISILILIRYLQRKNLIAGLLFLSFINLTIGILFSMISKIIFLNIYEVGLYPGDSNYWILARISGFRVSLVFVMLAIYFSYLLKINVFAEGKKPKQNTFFPIFAICSILFILLYSTWTFEKPSDDPIGFLLVAVFIFAVYIPFAWESIRLAHKIEERKYQKALYSLFVMAISFILIFVSFFLDNLMAFINGPSYSPFYFMAWIFAAIGMASAYFGYLRPGSK